MTRSRRITFLGILALATGTTLSGADTTEARWSIAIYLDGDNNLERYIVADFKEITSVTLRTDEHVRITAQLDRAGRHWDGDDAPETPETGRFRLSDPGTTRPTPLGRHRGMADPTNLTAFLDAVRVERAAAGRALIVGSHGDGSRVGIRTHASTGPADLPPDEGDPSRRGRAVLYDEGDDRDISVESFAQAIAKAGKVDVLGLDACLMGTVEVFTELEPAADLVVASEHEELPEGWDHSVWVEEAMSTRGRFDSRELAAKFLRSYERSVKAAGAGFTKNTAVVVRTNRAPELVRNLDEFAGVLLESMAQPNGSEIVSAIATARLSCRTLGVMINSNTVDLACFVAKTRSNVQPHLSQALLARVDLAATHIEELLCAGTGPDCVLPDASRVVVERVVGVSLVKSGHRGVGVYFPASRAASRTGATLESYRKARLRFFSLAPRWLKLIDGFLAARSG